MVLRVFPQKLYPLLHRFRFQHIVAVRPDQVLPCNKGKSQVNGGGGVFMLSPHNSEAVSPGVKPPAVVLRHLHCAVCGTVIHQNHVNPGIRLGQNRIQHFSQELRAVVYRSDDGYHIPFKESFLTHSFPPPFRLCCPAQASDSTSFEYFPTFSLTAAAAQPAAVPSQTV